ncbi:TetR/AcrR family transcriptional regulator [Labedella endophytica]|jgi:AcrR family transcriptional regulator|uniref:TetR family transcriptional regulator n=1 Tax=Labedella endophytica TaxID=1523160 RepID=A0A3S0XP17_9MICO|nr:TetR family transcriptional regulator [Labedella endophytica]RUR01811.1 TetR family transcriptional regulator [Labedella endophytica]
MTEMRKDAARNRERIVDAARDLQSRGEVLALNAVARAADVGVGTVYRHFATVEELEETLVWDRFDALDAILQETAPGQLERALEAHIALLVEDALFEKVTLRSEVVLPQTATARDALIAQLAELMSRAREDGLLRADVDAPTVLHLTCGLAHSIRASGAGIDSALARSLLRVAFDGLRAA